MPKLGKGLEYIAVYELPKNLQEVYNKLRLSEEDFEVLDEFLEKALIAIDRQEKCHCSDYKETLE